MTDYRKAYDETRRVLREWADRRGQDLCFWHPDILAKVAEIHDIKVPDVTLRRPEREEDFEEGCRRYKCEVVYPDRYAEGAD